jgi:hypothetical protein
MDFFARQLKHYVDRFRRRQICVGLYEDLQNDAAVFAKRLYDFIGVDRAFTPDVSARFNIGGVPRSRWLHRLIREPHPAGRLWKRYVPDRFRRRVQIASPRGTPGRPGSIRICAGN